MKCIKNLLWYILNTRIYSSASDCANKIDTEDVLNQFTQLFLTIVKYYSKIKTTIHIVPIGYYLLVINFKS